MTEASKSSNRNQQSVSAYQSVLVYYIILLITSLEVPGFAPFGERINSVVMHLSHDAEISV